MKKKLMTLQQHRLLKEAGQLIAFSERLKHAQKETTDRNWKEREEQRRRSAKAASTVTALSGDIEEFLTSRYDFRYNLLTDETEFRPAGQRSAAFTPVGKRELNTFCIEAHAEGIPCWDKDLNRYVYSTYIPAYHPFLLYMDELPDWDGKDRLTALAEEDREFVARAALGKALIISAKGGTKEAARAARFFAWTRTYRRCGWKRRTGTGIS